MQRSTSSSASSKRPNAGQEALSAVLTMPQSIDADDEAEDEDDEVAVDQAIASLRVVNALLSAFENTPEMYSQLEPICRPYILHLFEDVYYDFKEVGWLAC